MQAAHSHSLNCFESSVRALSTGMVTPAASSSARISAVGCDSMARFMLYRSPLMAPTRLAALRSLLTALGLALGEAPLLKKPAISSFMIELESSASRAHQRPLSFFWLRTFGPFFSL